MALKLKKPLRSTKVSRKITNAVQSKVAKKGEKKLTKRTIVERAAQLENFPELFLGLKA